VQYVFDTTLAAGFSILESQKEFIQRFRRRHHDSTALPMFTSSCPGTTPLTLRPLCTVLFNLPLLYCLIKTLLLRLGVEWGRGGGACY